MLASRGNAVALRTLIVELVLDNFQCKAWVSTYMHVYYCTWSNIGNAIKLFAMLYCTLSNDGCSSGRMGWASGTKVTTGLGMGL